MELWIIEPRDPLIVRDGRPFGPNPGARSRSLDFPYPSTVAGGLRTRAGQDGNGRFDLNLIPQVKQIGIRGPLLAELDNNDEPGWLAPAPGDALLLKDNDTGDVYRHRLQPLAMDDSLSNLPKEPKELAWPVGLPEPDPNKPYKDAPRYWYWEKFKEWLTTTPTKAAKVTAAELGHNGPGKEWRVHVAIDPKSLTGIDGALFATGGLEFWQRPSGDERRLSEVKRLGLAAAVENLNGLTIDEGFAPWGGERRTMRWRKSESVLPQVPNGLAKAIAQTGACRLILLTPACFNEGWRPEWLLETHHGATPELKAAVVGKPQTVSGWDFEKREAKPTRRLAPAGSVYFLKLKGDTAARQAWVEKMWLTNVSDAADDRLAGFGLTGIGVWTGKPQKMEVDNA